MQIAESLVYQDFVYRFANNEELNLRESLCVILGLGPDIISTQAFLKP